MYKQAYMFTRLEASEVKEALDRYIKHMETFMEVFGDLAKSDSYAMEFSHAKRAFKEVSGYDYDEVTHE